MSIQAWFVVGATLVGFAFIFIVGYVNMRRLSWPKGPQLIRTTALGVDVTVINAPGSDGEKLLLLDACQTATTAIFSAWRVWRPSDAGAETAFSKIGVNFIDDETMDMIGQTNFGERIAAYLDTVTSAFERVPCAVIRLSLVHEMIQTGNPLMHELLHAMIEHFIPGAAGNKDHTHIAWDLVQKSALATYHDLYAPTTRLQRVPPQPKANA